MNVRSRNNNTNWGNQDVKYSNYPDNFKRQMNIVNPSYEQIIVKPPKENVTHGRQSRKFVVDSHDRNKLLYPNPNNYSINIPTAYRDVISIQLVKAYIPNTDYFINDSANKFMFQELESSEPICITIPSGDYTPQSLQDILKSLMNAGSEIANDTDIDVYNVIIDCVTGKFIITSNFGNGLYSNPEDVIFKIIFEDCTPSNCKEPCTITCNVPYTNSTSCNCDGETVTYEKTFLINNIPHDELFRTCEGKKLLKNSIAEKIGFAAQNLGFEGSTTGSVTPPVFDALTSEYTLTGNGTKFLTEFKISENILIGGNVYTVVKIISDTEMTLSAVNTPITLSGTYTVTKGAYIAQNKFDMSSQGYVILDILEANKLDSNSTSISDAFAILPMVHPHNTKSFVIASTLGQTREIKHYNPPMGKLNKLTIKFKRYDGSLYDFNGLDHFLEFEIKTMNDVGFYNNNFGNV